MLEMLEHDENVETCRNVENAEHVGNVGTNQEDNEAKKSYASGVITRELPTGSSNWRSNKNLNDWLFEKNITYEALRKLLNKKPKIRAEYDQAVIDGISLASAHIV